MTAYIILDVEDIQLGSALAVAATAGDATITVAESSDFDEVGDLLIDTDESGHSPETLSYTAADPDTGVITLVGTLSSNHDADSPVYLSPASFERQATLASSNAENLEDEEGMIARVPHSLYDKIPVGVRDPENTENESVEAAMVSDELVISDVTGQEPVVDGSFIDPTTLPPPEVSDGDPPAASPDAVVEAGIGVMFVTWQGITNTDPVHYEVHVSTSSSFTPTLGDLTTLSVTTDATMVTINTLPDGSALSYGTPDTDGIGTVPYYVRIIAYDIDGAATPGLVGTAQPRQATGPDIAVQNIVADHIVDNTIDVTELAQILTLVGNTIQTATSGQRVTMDNSGIRLIDGSGNTLVLLPTDDGTPAQFNGQAVLSQTTIQGNLLIQGSTNEMDNGSVLSLTSQLSSPNSAPSLAFEYDTDGFVGTGYTQFKGLEWTLAGGTGGASEVIYFIGDSFGEFVLEELDATNPSLPQSRSKVLQADTHINYACGCPVLGAYVWTCYINTSTGAINVQARNLSDLSGAGTTTVTTQLSDAQVGSTPAGSPSGLAISSDGTHLLIGAFSASTGAKKVWTLPVSGATVTTGSITSQAQTGGVQAGASDGPTIAGLAYDGTNYVFCTQRYSPTRGTIEMYIASTHTLATAAGSVWTPDCVTSAGNSVQNPCGGLVYQHSQFHSLRASSPTIIHYSNWTWTGGASSDIFWLGYTWFDGTGTAPATLDSISIASPGVFTIAAGHGLSIGNEVSFTTTGALPTGLVAGTHYWVIASGFSSTAFEVSATPGGSAVNTSGTQSGTQKFIKYHETKMSTPGSVQLNGASSSPAGRSVSGEHCMRGQLRVISPSLPSGVTDTQVYELLNATSPTKTSMLRQTPALHASGSGAYTQYLTSYNASGSAYLDTNTFGAGTSTIKSLGTVTTDWQLVGDGSIYLASVTDAQRDSLPTGEGLILWDHDRKQVHVHNGTRFHALMAADSRELYAAMNSLGSLSGTTAFPIAYTVDPEVGMLTDIGSIAAGDLRGAAFMVNKVIATSAMGFLITAVGAGTVSNYLGATLFQMNSSGDWAFLANTGSSKVLADVNSLGWKKWVWRDGADTTNTPVTLQPGAVYVVAVTFGTQTTKPTISGALAGATASNNQLNFSQGAFFRNALVTGVSAKRTTNIASASLGTATFIPLYTLYS